MTTSQNRTITFVHPLTGLPIEPLGYRKDGRPVWPIMGGSGEGGDGGDGSGDPAGGDPAGGDPAGDPTPADPSKDADDSPWADPKKAQAEIERLRRENGADRTKAKEQAAEEARKAILDEFAQKLGFKEGDTAPTVEQLTAQLTEQTSETEQARAETRDTKAELVVWRNATDLGVDAAALTDSRAFERAIKDLDPSSDSFEADVKKAAQEAAENNPKLKSIQAAGKSGADLTGGSGEGAITQEQFKNMSGAERNQLAQTNPTLYAQLSGRA